MLKTKDLLILALSANLFGCSLGNVGNPQISVAVIQGSSCTGLSSTGGGSSTCTIQLTYNTNGVVNPTLSYTPKTQLNGINVTNLNNGVTSCQNSINNNSQGTCNVTLNYTTYGGAGTYVNLAFILGGTTSNTVTVSGN